MIYPANFEVKTGFDRIRAMLHELCLSDMGRQKVAKIFFSIRHDQITEWLESAEEFRQVLLSPKSLPLQDFFDLRAELQRLKIAGTFIDPEKLGELRCSLRSLDGIISYFEKSEKKLYPRLKKLVAPATFDPGLIKHIERILDDRGQIRDDASPELKKIRQEHAQKLKQVEVRIRQIYTKLKKDGITTEDAGLTIRSGRSVIPLPAANKRRIKGFIHDESASGQTVYIEPEEIFELNNEIRELESAEKREIIRILTAYSDELRPVIPGLMVSYDIMAEVDLLYAKARLALQINAFIPRFGKRPSIDFRKAFNPILFLAGKSAGKTVIPFDVQLNEKKRILIISGPNAGGKSVLLKTIGLLQYMLQCGLLIPAADESETGIFKSIFIEIGDEQSIENDLSTYSAHLQNMGRLTETAAPGLLFLIDEFGSGTDPQSGGAIAEAVLEKLSGSGALGVVTTHYLNLKSMAGRVEGIINGAMLFDRKNMTPLFKLSAGKPGSSFAFEIASKIGFPRDILETAKHKTGPAIVDFEHQLEELETERRDLEKSKTEFAIADELLTSLVERYKQMNDKTESSRKEILEKARLQATELFNNANKLIENTICSIKESQAEKEKTQEARQKLKRKSEELLSRNTEKENAEIGAPAHRAITKKFISKEQETPVVKKSPLMQGGYARITGQKQVYEIEDIRGNSAVLVRDNLRLNIPLDQIEGIDLSAGNPTDKSTDNRFKGIADELTKRSSEFKPSIDVRGSRAEEVHPLIQKFIDDAILLDVSEVRILHGKGFGVLRQIIHEYLRSVKEVKSFGDEAMERGGAGITVVRFR